MAKVDTPTLPQRLFRYRSFVRPQGIDEELKAITDDYIWCSDFTVLNDPMEGSCIPDPSQTNLNTYQSIIYAIYERKVELGIACFSEIRHSELMWAHYAGNHTGICIEYSAPNLLKALPEAAHMVRVGYVDEPPVLEERESADLPVAARRLLSHKKGAWSYEREWRVLATPAAVKLLPNSGCVTAVYLGTRIKDDHRAAVLERLRPKGVRIYKMAVDGYEHTATPIDNP
jgi:hypothetical protein